MRTRSVKVWAIFGAMGFGLALQAALWAQDAAPPPAEPPPVPKGVEVLARGPIHEAFATPTAEAQPTKAVPKQPPKPLDELPPEEKPEGDMTWIGGYWAWDDERTDFLWVSGIWRSVPRARQWVAGYWRENGGQWQWVPGFWAEAAAQPAAEKEVTYLPAPPAAPQVAAPGEPPDQNSFYVPGCYVWAGDHYAWKAGYWARVVPGYVWVPAHYRWTPTGYVFIPGYWDLAVSRRGVLYAPVVVDTAVVGPTFVFTPAYAVSDTIVLDALFVRPSYCHYYFGDYYGVTYREYGFESCYVYSRRNYDAIIVYERYEHRHEPRWVDVQINVYNDRYAGRAPVPPRTLVQQNNVNIVQKNVINQNVIVQNNVTNVNVVNNTKNVSAAPVLVPTKQLAAARGTKAVAVDAATRNQAKQQAQAVQQVAAQRTVVERAAPGGAPTKPMVTTLKVPPTPPVTAARPVATLPNAQPATIPAGPKTMPATVQTPAGKPPAAKPNVAAAAPPPAAPKNPTAPPPSAAKPVSAPPPSPATGGPASTPPSGVRPPTGTPPPPGGRQPAAPLPAGNKPPPPKPKTLPPQNDPNKRPMKGRPDSKQPPI